MVREGGSRCFREENNMLKGDGRGRGLFFLQIQPEGLGGGVFGFRVGERGLVFFVKLFFH